MAAWVARLVTVLQKVDDSDEEDAGCRDDNVRRHNKTFLSEYSLSKLGMAAANKWVRMMGYLNHEELTEIWLLMCVNRRRAP